jgi:hypothetical protein
VNIHKVEEKIKSKKELYYFLLQDCSAFLPSIESTNVYFLRAILKGEKEVRSTLKHSLLTGSI